MKPRRLAILAFFVYGAGLLCGMPLGRAPVKAELAALRQAHAETSLLAARSALLSLQEAQERGDALTSRLDSSLLHIDQLKQEKRDALKNATHGRACLGPAAVRVLNGAPGVRVALVPAATGSTAAADGTAAADTEPAGGERWISDSDIGAWTLDAGAQYEQCRERLGALITWWTKDKGPAL